MEGRFDIYLGGEKVGRTVVQRQGLYYRFDCRCNLKKGQVYRLMLDQGGRLTNLGIPAPSSDGYWLVTRKPIKEFSHERPEFRLVPKLSAGKFVPVYPDEPFAYLDRLQKAYMQVRDGVTGVIISAPDPQGSDQSP